MVVKLLKAKDHASRLRSFMDLARRKRSAFDTFRVIYAQFTVDRSIRRVLRVLYSCFFFLQIRHFRQQEGSNSHAVQQGEVSSSNPNILSNDQVGPILLEVSIVLS